MKEFSCKLLVELCSCNPHLMMQFAINYTMKEEIVVLVVMISSDLVYQGLSIPHRFVGSKTVDAW